MTAAGRPARLILVCGTATEVGKTWVTCALAGALQQLGASVAARKPVQSFEVADEAAAVTDAQLLGAATGEVATAVCPEHRWYPVPMAPPMAAAQLGRPVPTVAELAAEVVWPAGLDVGLVETVGGVRSPIAADGDAVALAEQLAPDSVLLVADATLGAINAVRLSAEVLRRWPVTVFLNRFDLHDEVRQRNRAWLADRDGFDVTTDVAELAERFRPASAT